MIRKGQWVLIPVRHIIGEKNLKLSPLGVVQQGWGHHVTIPSLASMMRPFPCRQVKPCSSGAPYSGSFEPSPALTLAWAHCICRKLTLLMVFTALVSGPRISPSLGPYSRRAKERTN
jgi:hypothetical protein